MRVDDECPHCNPYDGPLEGVVFRVEWVDAQKRVYRCTGGEWHPIEAGE